MYSLTRMLVFLSILACTIPTTVFAIVVQWKTLIVAYPTTDLQVEISGKKTHFTASLAPTEIELIQKVSRKFPEWIDSLSGQRIGIDSQLIFLQRPLTSVTERSKGKYWVAPKDVSKDLTEELGIEACQFDSLIVLWKSSENGLNVHTGNHGLTIGPSVESFGAGYTMIKLPFQAPTAGDDYRIMVHEWMHQSLTHYRRFGFEMPDIHKKYEGYPETGTNPWVPFYSDALQGKVFSEGKYLGISDRALEAGTPIENCNR